MDSRVYRFPDPVSRCYRYLNGLHPDMVARQEPDSGDYDQNAPLILIRDGGGTGETAYQLADVRLSFEVRAGTQKAAADLASVVEAEVRDWPNVEGGVYYRGTISRPQWSPEPDRRIPAYIWTTNFCIRGVPFAA